MECPYVPIHVPTGRDRISGLNCARERGRLTARNDEKFDSNSLITTIGNEKLRFRLICNERFDSRLREFALVSEASPCGANVDPLRLLLAQVKGEYKRSKIDTFFHKCGRAARHPPV